MLVRVYVILGAGSLALRAYKRLGIKNLQHETVAHMLYTRFSTIHPRLVHTYDNMILTDNEKDPAKALGVALSSYGTSARQATVGKRSFLEMGRYHMLLDLLEVEAGIKGSFSRLMLLVERRRMQRLCQETSHDQYADLLGNCDPYPVDGTSTRSLTPTVPFPKRIHDRRNYDSIPNYEAFGQPKFAEYLDLGPRPGVSVHKGWVMIPILMTK